MMPTSTSGSDRAHSHLGEGSPAYLAGLPHHDGSALYVPSGPFSLGQVVPVRVRVPLANSERAVHLRVVRDGEPRMSLARLVATDAAARWYEADVLVHNPRTHYRFLLDEPGGYRWLTAKGVFNREVPDAGDFTLTIHSGGPQWIQDAIVYQVFPDRFARSADADAHETPAWASPAAWDEEPAGSGSGVGKQFYGGDLRGVQEHLDYLQDLGVTTVYLTPVFPGRSNHRYDASTFDHVDPLLGGDQAMTALSDEIHARGMRIMGDVTTNHTGDGHEWFIRARSDETSPEHDYYIWTEQAPGYVSWLEHDSLPKLNHDSQQLRDRMIEGPDSVIAKGFGAPMHLDGWRVDVANMTGRYGAQDLTHEVARTIRTTIEEANPEGVLISEHFHDAGADLTGDGWHGNMNYTGFTRPAWTWLADPGNEVPFLGMPVSIPSRTGGSMVTEMRDFDSHVDWQILTRQWNLLGSHDTARIRTITGDPALVEVGAGLLFTYLGVPVVYAGDELGLEGTNGEHGRVPMPWGRTEDWDEATRNAYRELIALRGEYPALRTGSLRWVIAEDDAIGYVRETPEQAILVVLSRAAWAGATLPPGLADIPDLPAFPDTSALDAIHAPITLYGTEELTSDTDGLHLPGTGPAVGIWRLR